MMFEWILRLKTTGYCDNCLFAKILTSIINDETPDNRPPSKTTTSNEIIRPIAITITPIMNTAKNFGIFSDLILNQGNNLFAK